MSIYNPNIFNPIVLFAKEVFLRDLVDDLHDNTIQAKNTDIEYDKIPNKFINLESWPVKINTKCFRCSYNYDAPPIFIPDYFMTNGEIAIHKKLFCGFPCAKSYIIDSYHGHELQKMLHKLNYVYNIFTGTTAENIPSAIPLSDIKEFGGSNAIYTAEEYKKINKKLVPSTLYLI